MAKIGSSITTSVVLQIYVKTSVNVVSSENAGGVEPCKSGQPEFSEVPPSLDLTIVVGQACRARLCQRRLLGDLPGFSLVGFHIFIGL